VLLSKVNLAPGALILDYGCAKSTTLKLLTRSRPDLVPHLFDVSEMYVPFWQLFAPAENWATYKPKPEWRGRFEVVTSFFAFEHVSDPRVELASIAALLKTDGIFYCIVPNVYANTADFVVADHVHHYSPSSLERLLTEQGFTAIEVDDQAHHSAFVVTARKSEGTVAGPASGPNDGLRDRVTEMAAYWAGFAEKVSTFERAHGTTGRAAIYGSGFYGTFVVTCLQKRNRVSCFIDRNPFRQGKTLLGLPIVAPEELPADVTLVYVGLNPVHAREEIAKVESWRGRTLNYFYP
jgi:SAM-dependent methyltransferase